MAWRRWVAVFAAVAFAAASPAAAEWQRADTDHLIVYADARPAWVHDFAGRLERMDAALRYLRKVRDIPELRSNRLRVYVLSSFGELRRLCGTCPSVAGFYVPRVGSSVAFTVRNEDGGPLAVDSDIILFHEYTHHFLRQHFDAAFPRWFDEGFAEFNSTASIERDGSVGLGRVAAHRAAGLILGSRMTVRTVLDPDARISGGAAQDVFYGRAWLLVHMLTFSDARQGQLATYLAALGSGEAGLAAAEKAFGDLKALDRDLDAYMRKKMSYFSIKADKLKVGTVEVRPLGAGEAAMMSVRLRSTRGVNTVQAKALVPEARKRAAAFPDDPVVQAILAETEYDAGEADLALAAAERSIAKDPTNQSALIYQSRVLTDRLVRAKSRDAAAWRAARAPIVKANRADPNAAEPLMRFYLSFLAEGQKPSASAVAGLQRAFELSPHDKGLRLMYVRQLLIDKQREAARSALLPIAYDPHGGGEGSFPRRLLAMIDKGDTTDSIVAAGAAAGDGDDNAPPPAGS